MKEMNLTFKIYESIDGGFIGEIKEIPGAVSQGET